MTSRIIWLQLTELPRLRFSFYWCLSRGPKSIFISKEDKKVYIRVPETMSKTRERVGFEDFFRVLQHCCKFWIQKCFSVHFLDTRVIVDLGKVSLWTFNALGHSNVETTADYLAFSTIDIFAFKWLKRFPEVAKAHGIGSEFSVPLSADVHGQLPPILRENTNHFLGGG